MTSINWPVAWRKKKKKKKKKKQDDHRRKLTRFFFFALLFLPDDTTRGNPECRDEFSVGFESLPLLITCPRGSRKARVTGRCSG